MKEKSIDFEELDATIEEMGAAIEDLKAENETLRSENDTLKTQVEQYRKWWSEANAEKVHLKGCIAAVGTLLSAIQ